MSVIFRTTVCTSSNHAGGSTTTADDPAGYGNDMCKSGLPAPRSVDKVENSNVVVLTGALGC